jgi:polysaccharide pyruvyl transferase WcaK-like protein
LTSTRNVTARIVAIGDVGLVDDMVHLGDEAMFEQLVTMLRRRGIDDFVGISSNPSETATRYGISAVDRIGFAFSGPDARARMIDRRARVLRAAGGDPGALAVADTAWGVIDAIRSSDAVAIAGGGNIASNWPLHIFERATIGELAALFGKPLVITGQTIGPELTAADAPLVTALLSSARLVGLRERASLALVTKLGAPATLLTHTVDDASFLGMPDAAVDDPTTCVVSLSMHLGGAPRDAFVERMAELLDGIVATTALEIVFLAHFGSIHPGVSRGDSVLHDEVAAAMMSSRLRTVTPTTAFDAAALARGAALVVTSRYHPAVFAVAGGVPTIGIPVDEYTTIKLTGALGNFGQSAILPVDELISGLGARLVAATWNARGDIHSTGVRLAEEKRLDSEDWWDAVAAALRGA